MSAVVTEVPDRKAELAEFARKGGALVMGVADAARFEAAAPEGQRPADLLPHARSVVVVGGAQPRAGDWQVRRYQHMEISSTTDRITALANRITQHIERSYGYYALCVPPGVDRAGRPFVSLALAAELAGCGSPSLAGPVLHPEHGFMYFGAVITTLPLEPDAPPAEPACPAPQCRDMWRDERTTPCMKVCPIDAGGCLGGSLGEDGTIASRRFDRARCSTRVETYWIPGFQKALTALFDEQDPARRRMILNGTLFTRTLWSMTYANVSQGQCFECMRVCPVGAARRTLR